MNASGCICIDFRSVTNRLTQLYDAALAPSGMTVTQFSQFNTIQKLGSPTLNELAEALGLDRSTLGRNVRLLERLGFVSMSPGEDARTRIIEPTAAGVAAFERAAPLWFEVQEGLNDVLGAGGKRRLETLLNQVDAACAAQAHERAAVATQ